MVTRFLARRDEEAFRAIFRRYSPRLLAMALRLTGGNHGDAEDVVQEAWTRATRRLAGFEWRSSLSTWLQSIVINCVRERWRIETWASLDEGLRTSHRASRTTHGASEAIDLERAIADLPEGYRAVLVLHDVEGYTHTEIAALCGISAGTSKSQLFHARRALRARLSRSF